MANGIPTGAIVADGRLKEFFGPGSHGTTFGGNPIAMAAATKTMEIIFQPTFLEEVQTKSEWIFSLLKQKLSGNQLVKDIRGLGLMIGIELDMPVVSILEELRKEGLIVLNAGEKVIRLLPSLNTPKEDIERAIAILEKNLNIHAKLTI